MQYLGRHIACHRSKHVNPAQVPVIAFDQPLFALAKQIQWEMQNTHGEDHLVVMFGALHVAMAAFKALANGSLAVVGQKFFSTLGKLCQVHLIRFSLQAI